MQQGRNPPRPSPSVPNEAPAWDPNAREDQMNRAIMRGLAMAVLWCAMVAFALAK